MNKYVAKQSKKFSIPQIKSYLRLITFNRYVFKYDIWYFETEKEIIDEDFNPFEFLFKVDD